MGLVLEVFHAFLLPVLMFTNVITLMLWRSAVWDIRDLANKNLLLQRVIKKRTKITSLRE